MVTDPRPSDRLEVVPGGMLTAGDWETVYRDHVGPVYRFIYSRVGNRPDAEDITATVFERALPRLRSGALDAQLRAYLLSTARTTLADHWRARHGVDVVDEDDFPASVAHEGGIGADRDLEVERLLDGLPGNYRQVLELRFLRSYSLKETALAMGTSVGNVKVMQMRALRRAAQEFGQ